MIIFISGMMVGGLIAIFVMVLLFISKERQPMEIFQLIQCQIQKMKTGAASFHSSDYRTGYCSALSTLEGFIAALHAEADAASLPGTPSEGK